LILAVVEAMRLRYSNERSRKEKASYDAYDAEDDYTENGERAAPQRLVKGEKGASEEGIHSQVIEKLILGTDILPKNDISNRPDDDTGKSQKKSAGPQWTYSFCRCRFRGFPRRQGTGR
jgi:hypothetical protein